MRWNLRKRACSQVKDDRSVYSLSIKYSTTIMLSFGFDMKGMFFFVPTGRVRVLFHRSSIDS